MNVYISTASSLSDSVGSSGGGMVVGRSAGHRHGIPPPSSSAAYVPLSDTTNLEVLEYPFLTMKTYPPGFITHIGNSIENFKEMQGRIAISTRQYFRGYG